MQRPTVTVILREVRVSVVMHGDEAGKITKSNLHELALSAIGSERAGLQMEICLDGKAVPATAFIEGPDEDDMEISDCDDEFETLLAEDPSICG